jgi:uracil-DNA glycosylase
MAGYSVFAPPLVWGRAPAPFMLIGQAPGRTDLIEGKMFRGPAAMRLFGWLRFAGFTDEEFGTILYMTAITKCFPGRLPGKSTDRAPSNAEIALCRHWLDQQLALVQPQVILLLGKMSIDRVLGPSALSERIGQSFAKDGVLYIPLPHSSGASVWLNDATNKALLSRALELVRRARQEVISDSAVE